MSLFDSDLIKKEPILSFLDKFGYDLKNHLENNHDSYVFSYHTHGRHAVMKAISILIRTLKEREKYIQNVFISGKGAIISASGQYEPDTYVTEIGGEIYIKIGVVPRLLFVPPQSKSNLA